MNSALITSLANRRRKAARLIQSLNIMNIKKASLISILVFTNLITLFLASIFFIEMNKNIEDLDSESRHFIEEAEFNATRFRQFIFNRHKDMGRKEFIEKYKVDKEAISHEEDLYFIANDLIYFFFREDKLIDIK